MNVNYYNPYVRAELEFYHHGINGQRWGKRHGPPYPLGKSQVSAAEKKAGWKKSDWADGKPTKKRVVKSTSVSKKNKVKAAAKRMQKVMKQKINSITPEQKAMAKRIAITAVKVAAVAGATYAGGLGLGAFLKTLGEYRMQKSAAYAAYEAARIMKSQHSYKSPWASAFASHFSY